MNKLKALALASTIAALSACGSDNDDNGGSTTTPSEPGTFQVTFTNMTSNQLMTPPVVAIHDPSAHLFQVGETASDAIRDIAETGNSDALVAFAQANPELVTAATVVGAGPFGPGGNVTGSLTTTESGQVFSAVNMVICTNDGISGADSIELPAGTDPVTMMAMAYDAGTRDNTDDAQSFFPPPCKVGETVPNPETDPRAAIAAHPGQTVANNNPDAPGNPADWNIAAGAEVLMIEIVRN